MGAIKTEKDLKIAIQELEYKKACNWILVKEEVLNVQINLRPLNIVKRVFKETVASPEIKSGILNNAIGVASGFIARKIIVGNTTNPVRKFLGAMLERMVASKVSKNINGVKETLDEV